ncbi:hypothetical protein ACFLT9_10355 [Acidobacteriota bacterium]
MSLREILEQISDRKDPILLCDRNKDWEANDLLANLTDPQLRRNAHLQPGLYIALINEGGYLGEVLYRVKQKI